VRYYKIQSKHNIFFIFLREFDTNFMWQTCVSDLWSMVCSMIKAICHVGELSMCGDLSKNQSKLSSLTLIFCEKKTCFNLTLHVFHFMGTDQPWIVSMVKVANMTIWGRGLSGYNMASQTMKTCNVRLKHVFSQNFNVNDRYLHPMQFCLTNLNSDTKEQYTTSYNTCWGQVRPERLVSIFVKKKHVLI
jgi:hypothetical protein